MTSGARQTVNMPISVRTEMLREATVMALYVAIVEIAELAALPESHLVGGHVTGATGSKLLEVLWGTAVGLALAHWFAFRVVAPAFRGGRISRHDSYVGFAQVGGAIFVATLSSLPVVFFSDVRAQETTGDVPALLIGIIGYLIARRVEKSHLASLFYGLIALVLGVLVAVVKSLLAAH